MTFSVEFTIKLNGRLVSEGILVYQTVKEGQRSRKLYPDELNKNGFAKTEWDDVWKGEEIDVFCHTDGINDGTPAFVDRVALTPNASYKLFVEPEARNRWHNNR